MTNGRTLEQFPERRAAPTEVPAKLAVFVSAPGGRSSGLRRARYQADFFCRVRNRSLCFPKTLSCPVKAPGGRSVTGWCIVPSAYLVAGDVMLAQKIALETNEKAVLELVNGIPLQASYGATQICGARPSIDGSSANYSHNSCAVRVSGRPGEGRARGRSEEEISLRSRAGSRPSVELRPVGIPG